MTSGITGRALVIRATTMAAAAVVGAVAIGVALTSTPAAPATPVPVTDTTEPRYVPLCVDADGLGPCVGQVGDSGMWLYVSYRHTWPDGQGNGTLIPGVRTIELCPTEDGGPVACAWVPSVQNNNMGDSGALVYGIR